MVPDDRRGASDLQKTQSIMTYFIKEFVLWLILYLFKITTCCNMSMLAKDLSPPPPRPPPLSAVSLPVAVSEHGFAQMLHALCLPPPLQLTVPRRPAAAPQRENAASG